MQAVGRAVNIIRRTFEAFVPAAARPDDAFAQARLTREEYGVYSRMDVRDRAHSVLVARRLLADDAAAAPELVAAALLHDCAKALLPFQPLHRIAVHFRKPRGLPARPLRDGFQGALQLREHHERLGAELIRQAGGRETVAQLVAALADDEGAAAADVRQLRKADSHT